ncbi:hypothetical protein ACHAWF_011534 [Thalassiosira exigua]
MPGGRARALLSLLASSSSRRSSSGGSVAFGAAAATAGGRGLVLGRGGSTLGLGRTLGPTGPDGVAFVAAAPPAAFVGRPSLPGNNFRPPSAVFSARPAVRALGAATRSEMSAAASTDDGGGGRSAIERLASRLVLGRDGDGGGDEEGSVADPIRACVAVAGGGSGAASAIAATPGASSILLESVVAYDRGSFADFVARNLGGDEEFGGSEGGATRPSDASGASSGASDASAATGTSREFKFCSEEAAVLLARAALRRSQDLSPSFRDKAMRCVGVGCASSLAGNSTRTGRASRIYVAASAPREGTAVWDVELDRCVGPPEERRTRSEEDAVASKLILLAAIEHRERWRGSCEGTYDVPDSILEEILDRKGDAFRRKVLDGGGGARGAATAAEGASRVADGKASVVAVLPTPAPRGGTQGGPHARMEALCADDRIPFPRDALIVPGSFNPPHGGHVGLANAAVSALRRLRREERRNGDGDGDGNASDRYRSRHSSVSSASSTTSPVLRSLLDAVDDHVEDRYDPSLFFEMSVTNADKPPTDPDEAGRRVDLFATLPPEGMPSDWSVLLTDAPLFARKAEVLGELMPGGGGGDEEGGGGRRRRMSFVIGTDTFVRIIDPKYYGNSREAMLEALEDMWDGGVRFIVGGRLEQGAGGGTKFINGEEELRSLPPEAQRMFTLLTEDEFRLDISSTELRKGLEKK